MEAAMPLYGHELSETITPLEAGLNIFVKLDKEFLGKEALKRQAQAGVSTTRIGFTLLERGIPRQGYAILCGGEKIGAVTSGGFFPTLNGAYGMAYVQAAKADGELQIDIRGKLAAIKKVALPFYKKGGQKITAPAPTDKPVGTDMGAPPLSAVPAVGGA
jgi:aminomethyltransferase